MHLFCAPNPWDRGGCVCLFLPLPLPLPLPPSLPPPFISSFGPCCVAACVCRRRDPLAPRKDDDALRRPAARRAARHARTHTLSAMPSLSPPPLPRPPQTPPPFFNADRFAPTYLARWLVPLPVARSISVSGACHSRFEPLPAALWAKKTHPQLVVAAAAAAQTDAHAARRIHRRRQKRTVIRSDRPSQATVRGSVERAAVAVRAARSIDADCRTIQPAKISILFFPTCRTFL